MINDVKARGFTMTDALRAAVHRETVRLVQGLGRPILRISVRLFDVNGSRHGGPDKGCRVRVHFADGGHVVGTEVGSDLYQSITGVFGKVLRSGRDAFGRRRTRRLRLRARTEASLAPT